MRTTFHIPASLLNEAKVVAGVSTKTQAVVLALNELIQRRKSKAILELKGTLKQNYDYKTLRRKR